MEKLTIERRIGKDNIKIMLTEDELEKAYRIKEKRYLNEDFANALADAMQDLDSRFHSGHLEEFPELAGWLCKCFDDFNDANISHNDLIESVLNHLQQESLKPEFFTALAENVHADCMETEKNTKECEQNCWKYRHCSHIAEADDRRRRWKTLASMLAMHCCGDCTCDEDGNKCPAAKYLDGTWGIREFFYSDNKKK